MASRIVFAFTIGKVEEKGWDYRIVPADTEQFTAVLVDAQWVKDHAPQPGGTITRYDNGFYAYTPPRSTESPPAPPVFDGGPSLAERESLTLGPDDVGKLSDPEDERELEP